MTDPLQCTFADAARNHLRDGIRLSTAAKVDFFEEMVTLAVHFGARNRTAERKSDPSGGVAPIPCADRDAQSSAIPPMPEWKP